MKKTFSTVVILSCILVQRRVAKPASSSVALPLSFERNRGQANPEVEYISRTAAGTILLTQDGIVVTDGSSTSRARLAGAAPRHLITAEKKLPARVTYHRDTGDIVTDTYAAVRHRNIYPGIDLVFHGDGRQLEYDFEVAPGASTNEIHLVFGPEDELRLNEAGELLIHSAGRTLRQRAPVAYQESDGTREYLTSKFKLTGPQQVGFEVSKYDRSRRLVIDPDLTYSTYLGGTGGTDVINDVAVDAQGYIYVTGSTGSPNFPAVNSQQQFTGKGNAFVAKLTPDGSSLVYSTFFGQGNGGTDSGNGVVADANGNAYFTGYLCQSNLLGTAHHAYVGKLNPDGSVAFFNPSLTGATGDSDERPAIQHSLFNLCRNGLDIRERPCSGWKRLHLCDREYGQHTRQCKRVSAAICGLWDQR